jgi:hypothetical protein
MDFHLKKLAAAELQETSKALDYFGFGFSNSLVN